MKVKTLLLAGSLPLLAACSESEYDLDNLVPEQYHKILYVNNSGKQDLTLFNTDEDNKYTLLVVKGGSKPDLTAAADVRVLSQEELDDKYSNPEGVRYKILGDICYYLDATHLDFSASDRYKAITIYLKPQSVKAAVESDPTATWVLPLCLVSKTDSINAEKNEMFLKVTGVIMPTLGFVDASLNLKVYDYGVGASISEKITIGFDTENKWDVSYELAVDEDYIATFNADSGTVFKALPEGTLWSVPESMTLPNGTTITSLTVSVTINSQLPPGDYMLPIRIKSVSKFEISSSKNVYPLAIRIMGPLLDRTDWTAEANSESGNAGYILDNDPNTKWESDWWTPAPLPHELIIDTKEEYTFSQLAMTHRNDNLQYADTKGGEFYVSSDKAEWTKVGNFTMKKVFDAQVFAITPTKGRYIKIKITQTYESNRPYGNLSEVNAYGLRD
jgi:hypothetical protein